MNRIRLESRRPKDIERGHMVALPAALWMVVSVHSTDSQMTTWELKLHNRKSGIQMLNVGQDELFMVCPKHTSFEAGQCTHCGYHYVPEYLPEAWDYPRPNTPRPADLPAPLDTDRLPKEWSLELAQGHVSMTRTRLTQDHLETIAWLGLALARIQELERREDGRIEL